MRLLILAGLGFIALATEPDAPTGAASTAAAALAADDECQARRGEGCALNALQYRAAAQQASQRRLVAGSEEWQVAMGVRVAEEEQSGCHTTQPGEACFNEVMWAVNDGMVSHPEWYPGLTPDSPIADIQAVVHAKNPVCPRPCSAKAAQWCSSTVAPRLWSPIASGEPVTIKILSYNLFWWNLFKLRAGNGNSAGILIKDNMEPAFDVMGFQECENPDAVLAPVGLLAQYTTIQGPHATCMAYRTDAWSQIARGEADVGEDMATRYYGRRGTQWIRLKHTKSSKTLFFINHHGPLSINSGGRCGGQATAYNLLDVMAKNAAVGDVIVLVGDFNANAGSLTIQSLWDHLVHVFVGDSFGGVDNIFSNVGRSDIVSTKIMGSGGSDHNAITATIKVGESSEDAPLTLKAHNVSEPLLAAKELTGEGKPGYDWQWYWCGLVEDGMDYVLDTDAWNASSVAGAHDPDRCCRECQANAKCASWIWKDFSAATNGPECVFSGAHPKAKQPTDGFVAGLSYTAAAETASMAAEHALARI